MKQVAGWRRWWIVLVGALIAYLMLAYVMLPALWSHHEHEPGLASLPMVTRTASGIPGDALNVGLVGTKEDVLRAMHAAGWFPADPITLRSSIEIVGSVVLDRPYHDAPVSPLYYEGRKEELAFEKPDGRSADRRHHVRFWQVLDKGTDGRPVWLGSVTFDRGVGLSMGGERGDGQSGYGQGGEESLLHCRCPLSFFVLKARPSVQGTHKQLRVLAESGLGGVLRMREIFPPSRRLFCDSTVTSGVYR